MADFTEILDDELLPDAPITSLVGFRLRDNPEAMFEGADDAPRLLDAALGATATTVGRDWVLARTALAQVGVVGTYGMFLSSSGSNVSPGATAAGSTLLYSNAGGTTTAGAPAGTWRLMGWLDGTGASKTSLWLRIS